MPNGVLRKREDFIVLSSKKSFTFQLAAFRLKYMNVVVNQEYI